MKILQNKKKNNQTTKHYTMRSASVNQSNGFALVVSIVTTSILLLISFVVVNVALKQLYLAYSGQESQYAFYNAESGVECAMYWDLKNGSDSTFTLASGGTVTCNSQIITTGSQSVQTSPATVSQIGGSGPSITSIFQLNLSHGCSIVSVVKSGGNTNINSRGYNTCASGASRRFERGITIIY
jgi:hypothetical protein